MDELWGEGVGLRPVRAEDRSLIAGWLTDRELRRFTGRRAPPRIGETPHDVQFLILVGEERRPIGLCGLYGIAPEEGTAEVGILLGERDSWGHGYGPEALGLLLRYAYSDLGLRGVSLCVHATNARAIRAYEKVGFTVEQHLTLGRWLFGRGVDYLIMTSCAPGRKAEGGER
jgi:RimJ/RimL family protein N-acetyltransferase